MEGVRSVFVQGVNVRAIVPAYLRVTSATRDTNENIEKQEALCGITNSRDILIASIVSLIITGLIVTLVATVTVFSLVPRNINECNSQPCLNNGTCVEDSVPNSYRCICTIFAVGPQCQNKCDPNCVSGCNSQGQMKCDFACKPGFAVNSSFACSQCDPNCVSGCFLQGPGKCDSACVSRYGLTSSKTCAECDPNCLSECDSKGPGRCDLICNTTYVLETTNYTCLACDPYCVSGCIFQGPGKCENTCKDGYGLNSTDHTCAQCDRNCQSGCNTRGAGKCDGNCTADFFNPACATDTCGVCTKAALTVT